VNGIRMVNARPAFFLRARDILTCLIARLRIQSVFNAINVRDVQVLRPSDVILKSHQETMRYFSLGLT